MLSARQVTIILIHALVGWALCGATMGIGMAVTTLENTLVIHAVGAPLFFAAVTSVYVKRFNYTTPLQTAVAFVLFVIVVDFFVVALVINKSLEMFTSILGTWIPFLLIFVSTYETADLMSESKKDVEVKQSHIEGLGMFAARPYRAGQRIRRVNVVREITPESPIREELGERLDHCDYPDGKVVLIGFPDRHLNHSCDPNAYQFFGPDGSYVVARRDIRRGEEITCDYNINITAGTAWPCNCGAKRCLKKVVGDFFLLPVEWQHEYRPLLAHWFVRRNRERIGTLVAIERKVTVRS